MKVKILKQMYNYCSQRTLHFTNDQILKWILNKIMFLSICELHDKFLNSYLQAMKINVFNFIFFRI